MRAYLDWNATAPLRAEARAAMTSATDLAGNPSSVHLEGRKAKAAVEHARAQVARACCVDPEEVIFTSGSTEASALALAGRNLVSAPIEHDAVLSWTRPELPVSKTGTVVVSEPSSSALQVANSETGVIQVIPDGLAVSDATQAFGKIQTSAQIGRTGMVFLSAHKIGGPKGVGALISKSNERPAELIKGGGQEFGRRSGTENIVGIAGFGAAAAAAARDVADGVWDGVRALRDALEHALLDAADGLKVFGVEADRLPNTSCFCMPGWKGESQVIQMDLAGFAISAGSACSSGKVTASGVLEAMGASRVEASSSIRVSIGPSTTRDQLMRFASAWIKCCKRFKSRTSPSVRVVPETGISDRGAVIGA